MNEYKVYTKSCYWIIYADDDVEAMRKALWFCWRDEEEFVKIVRENYHSPYTLRIAVIDNKTFESYTI
ncbi:MAG: hypothetical protein IJE18_08315 [Bacteroidaceae bacterium]|nr:hypothetical protein [Bacteroidaceae bacterium]